MKLDAALTAGKIWNTEYQDWAGWVKQGCEHAQHVASDGRGKWDNNDGRTPSWPQGDPRWDIGYAFQPNQAASLLRRLKKLSPADIIPPIKNYMDVLEEIAGVWVYLQQFKSIIVKGRKPNPNAVEPDLSNTGHCPICGKLQKLGAGNKMVDHGFTISNGAHYFGYREGHCFGFKYPPYELSSEGCTAFITYLEEIKVNVNKRLTKLKSGSIQTLTIKIRVRKEFGRYEDEDKEVVKGTPEFDRALEGAIQRAEGEVSSLQHDIDYQTEKVKVWQLAPLPHGGPKTSGFTAKLLNKKK